MRERLERNDRAKYYLAYTLLFVAFFLITFLAFFIENKSLIWKTDGLAQDYPGAVFLRKWVKEILYGFLSEGKIEVRMWDMTIGEGGSVLNAIGFRPLSFLSQLVKGNQLEFSFWIRLSVCLYLSGIAFLWFCKLFKKLDYACLLGAVIYVFGGVVIGYTFKHVIFLEWGFYFPLMLYGTEKILRKESGSVFVCTVALAGLSYFYSLYICTLFSVIYAAIRFFYIKKEKSIKIFAAEIIKFAKYYLIGLGLAAISFLPSLMQSFSSGRTDSANRAGLSLFYDLSYYFSLLTAALEPTSAGVYGFLMFPAVVLLLIARLFTGKMNHGGRERQLRLMVLIGVVLMSFPIFALMSNGGGGITNRWFFVASFGGGLLVAFGLKDTLFFSVDRIRMGWFFALTCIYCLLCIVIGHYQEVPLQWWVFLYIYLALYLYALCSPRTLRSKRVCCVILTCILFLEMGAKAYHYYGPEGHNILSGFLEPGTVEDTNRDVAARVMNKVDDDSIYRVDSVEYDYRSPYLNRNYGFRVGVNGIGTYFSYAPGGVTKMASEVGLSHKYQSFSIFGYDQRTVLDELASVKYLTAQSGQAVCVPYGYQFLKEIDGISIYENHYSLPLIYAYPSVYAEEDYLALSANQKEQVMLQGAVVEQDIDTYDLPKCAPEFNDSVVLDAAQIREAQSQQNGSFELTDKGISCDDTVTFEFELPYEVTGEVYLLFEDLEYKAASDSGDGSARIRAAIGDTWKLGYTLGPGGQYYSGGGDFLINLGYVESCSSNIKISFMNRGEYTYDNLQLLVQPMDDYSQKVDALRIPVEDLSMEMNTISADLTLAEDRMVCIAVPYERGWHISVNGETVEAEQINRKYMGIALKEGTYHLEMHYVIPGLFAGAVISILTIMLLTVMAIVRELKIQKVGHETRASRSQRARVSGIHNIGHEERKRKGQRSGKHLSGEK